MSLRTFTKDADDTDSFPFDWTLRLDGGAITASEWIVPAPLELVTGTAVIAGAITGCQIRGGVAGMSYVVTNRVSFDDGRRLDADVTIAVKPLRAVG